MTLIEAVKSGKPFKRPTRNSYYYDPADFYADAQHMREEYFMGCVLADDWEIKPGHCKHEPIVAIQTHCTYLGDPTMIGEPIRIRCKHCGLLIKAKEWIEA